MQTLYIFLLDNPPATAPATAPIAFPTPGTAVPKIAPATPRLTLNFLFDVVMEILPHLGHDTIPAFLFALYCFLGETVCALYVGVEVLFILGAVYTVRCLISSTSCSNIAFPQKGQ